MVIRMLSLAYSLMPLELSVGPWTVTSSSGIYIVGNVSTLLTGRLLKVILGLSGKALLKNMYGKCPNILNTLFHTYLA